ncbi:ral GTPase-activating protein subunit alpha-1-like isoform X5 [Ostrea edulis]|uniref:ral GTPase-activating protein subunit alpha-1-like isoform X5 n=1 Tax=Ostrea edulis TaxID=37623 RepID=UPI0024AF6A21|nr:ral GTPase-activating protein subunit alpha-1-like isoform X5 [Ostrea edulis]
MSSVLDMFRKGTKDGDLKKSVQKVSDPKKDALTRLKHLRHVLDNHSLTEAKAFFEANYSHIYFIFNDNFSTVEADLKQRANRAHREELDGILFVFEKILILLPELIHKRWMFHSIGRVLKKLLHPGNGLKVRKDGIRLFMLWYQILNENASEECHEIFLQLVPGLGKGVHQEVLYGKSPEASESCSGTIMSGDITPILPSSGEKLPENITKHYFDALLYYMVSEVTKVEWTNKMMRETCFIFLFDNFKSSYLMWLLPTFDKMGDIYNPKLDLPESRRVSELESHDMPGNVSDCRYSFIKWLAHFVFISKQQDKAIENQVPETVGSEEDITESDQPMAAVAENMPGSNTSTLSTGSHHSELESLTSSLCYEEWGNENEIVRTVLFSTRENINIIHESFRQAFLFSLNQSKSIKMVISVYKDWFQHDDQKPIFMQEPSDIGFGHAPEFHHSSLSDILEEDSSDESAPQTKDLSKSLPSLDSINNSRIRNASYLGAIGDLADGGKLNDVRAGIQKVLQVFIVNSANVFLLQTDDESAMSEQVDLCKKVINIYRYLVMNIKMEQKTWEKMLQVLLCITTGVLGDVPIFNQKATDLQKRLATPIFQTIIVTWIRANLNVFVSGQLWDQFLEVLSSLSGWSELIRQWANTMDTLTRVLAKQVYGLDLTDLPLQRLTEQKEKRRRGKSQEIPRNRNCDKSFSRSWSKNEPPYDKAFSSTTVPFERGKYKSDGAGGGKSRPDLNKQRSLSGEPSPSHSRQPSNASDSALYLRSNSDGNLADPKDLVERLKGVSSAEMREKHDSTDIPACTVSVSSTSENIDSPAPEDLEVAKLSMHSLQSEADIDSISLERSEQDTSYRYSRSPSPASIHSQSPSPISELTVHQQQKDCPTPDRDSLHIEMAATTTDGCMESKECTDDMRSVLAGGTVQGWLPDSAVVLWRRMLGILGDVNQITDPENHVLVYEELSRILDTLHKIRNNIGVTEDNTFSPPPPDCIPPTTTITPWQFECLTLSDDFKKGKLLAYQLLCQTVVRRHDVSLPDELLSQFYMWLHTGIGSKDQEIVNVLVRHCGPRFFSMPLMSSTLLIKNLIHAVGVVLSSPDLRQTPRSEALSLIGSLVCFPNHYPYLQVLSVGDLSVESLSCKIFKDSLIDQLLHSAKKESAETARCIALSSIGVYLYEELCHRTLHARLHEAVMVLLGNLRCKNKVVAKTAADVLSILCDHTDQLFSYHTDLPKLIIEVVTATVAVLIPLTGLDVSQEERKLIVGMLFCVVEWCMRMPISLLLETTDTDRSCVFKVFQVLDLAVKGHSTETLSQARQVLAGMIQGADFDHLRDLQSPVGDYKSDRKSSDSDSIQCAAKLLINHMVNHMCHFPMGSGASRLSSSIQEHHDMEELEVNDLKQEIFYSSNIQFFVQNKRTLISFIELPAMVDVPGGGVTAGLTTARTVCRVLLRDLTGKYAWESSMLYAPPWCQEGSSVKNAKALLDLSGTGELEPLLSLEDREVPHIESERPSSEMPLYNLSLPHHDNLNDMLRYIGHTSPECHLIPGEPLNLEAATPEGFSMESEEAIKRMVVHQKENELNYYAQHKADNGSLELQNMLAKPQVPSEAEEAMPPFQMCRMMLDQLGLLAWEQRCHFDLLRKSDKLLRELKNLDNQKCRETHKFAVIYVAEGQEDKNSILSNCGGSKAFEDFVSGLGWEVDLETHQGFLGGLQQNRTTGDTAPYYATSLTECIFHVSTRMPSGTDDAMHIKMRHLGNDEIHIVWSEHTRDYRRGIIPTEFGDVLIIIYPLPSGLYRIEINKKAEVPYFGPLFDGAILDRKVLPGLVRSTAISASRVKRSLLPFYHSFYEERAKNFETVIQQHVDFTMFEDFAANVFAPVLPQNAMIMDQSQDLSVTASMISIDQSQSSAGEQVSPAMPRQSRAGSSDTGIFERTARRLSLNRRKASKSSSTSQHQTPPESPEARTKKS